MLHRPAAVILAALLLVTGCGGADRVGDESGDPHVLTLVNPIDDTEEIAIFAQQVGRLSHGSMRIDIERSPHQDRLDYERAVIDDVRAGRADFAWAGSRAWDGSLLALNAPLLIDSYELEERVLGDGLVDQMLEEELEPLGLAGIGVLPGPLRRPLGLHGRLVDPHDFAGLAIGEQQSRVAIDTLRALGAHPVELPVAGVADGLDGVETSMAAVEAGRYDKPSSHLAENVIFWPRPLVVFANADAYAALSGDEREILSDAIVATRPILAARQRTFERESAANICRRGGMAIDTARADELRSLRAAVEPVYRHLGRDAATRAALVAIAAAKRELAAPPAALPACGLPDAPAERTRTPLDGTWRMDTDRSAAAPDFLEENWGLWIFVFDHGRFAITQENRAACTWGYGSYSVDGDVTTWRFTDGGGKMPNNASNKPGEQFSFRLSLFRDTATLGPVPGKVSPGNFDAEPWRRLGPPTVAHFSRRCPPPAEALAPLR
jgi:TRAP-type C4-dicarboxylate transport system substrate-binding protein